MKFIGKDISELNKGYFGVRRCTICNDELRDVDLVEIYLTRYFCFIPVYKTLLKRILVCGHCKAYMELDEKLWKYYETYYNHRFDKATTDNILNTLNQMNKYMTDNGVKLSISDDSSQRSIDLIYKSLCEKYNICENVEEIVSVYYK